MLNNSGLEQQKIELDRRESESQQSDDREKPKITKKRNRKMKQKIQQQGEEEDSEVSKESNEYKETAVRTADKGSMKTLLFM